MTLARRKNITERLGLTLEGLEAFRKAAMHTWQVIASDCVEANKGKELSREAIVEVVLDNDNMWHNSGPYLTEEVENLLRDHAGAKYTAKKEAIQDLF